MKQPPLPAAKNRLLGRWVMLTKSQASRDDVGQGVCTVAFDFDEDGPGGQLIAVTLFYLAEAADLPRLLEQRAAAVATVYGPLSATSPGHHEGKIGAVRITLGIDAAASAVIETYRVRQAR